MYKLTFGDQENRKVEFFASWGEALLRAVCLPNFPDENKKNRETIERPAPHLNQTLIEKDRGLTL
jgi:hypothetical protein